MIGLVLASSLALTASGDDARAETAARLARLVEVAAIDEACAMLPPAERAILDREIASVRHQAEAGGMSSATWSSGSERIRRRWASPDCGASAAQQTVLRYRQALNGWLMGGERSFEGQRRVWTARAAENEHSHWALAQDAVHDGISARFGSVIIGEDTVVLLSLRAPRQPASAVLVLRDVQLAPRPVDFTSGGRRQPPGGEPLAGLGALSSGQRRIWTSGVLRDGGRFAPGGDGVTASFTFPGDTLEQMMALEAAEAARVDLYDASGARMGRIWIEIGALRQARNYALAANPSPLQ
ncbi:hypothetical protein [Glycocaulis sp.]|uniref:hypothetical protein n=1 Tax=Glycocaulis sp. TaxID=1969725 RepID=UPI003F731222